MFGKLRNSKVMTYFANILGGKKQAIDINNFMDGNNNKHTKY